MENDAEMIQPRAAAPAPAATPAPDETPAPAEDNTSAGLPDDLLKLPVMQALMAGAPPAASASIDAFQKRPEAKLILENKDELMSHGFGFYRSLDGGLAVLFNQLKIQPDAIKAADKAGKLLDVAPPFDQVNDATAKSGANNPVLTAGQPSAASANHPTPPQSLNAPMPPPQLQAARTKALVPGAPSSGPVPGQGRILNAILKPVV